MPRAPSERDSDTIPFCAKSLLTRGFAALISEGRDFRLGVAGSSEADQSTLRDHRWVSM